MKKLFSILTLAVMVALIIPSPVFAAGGIQDGRVVLGDNFVLQSGETLTGDLLVLGGNVTLEIDSTVIGDILVVGGNVDCEGVVQGDISLLGGNIELFVDSETFGDINVLGGTLEKDPGAVLHGSLNTGQSFVIPGDFSDFDVSPIILPDMPGLSVSTMWANSLASVFWYLSRSIIIAGLAALVVLFWPKPTRKISDTIIDQPLVAGGIGLLSLLLAPFLIIMLSITVILIPLSFLIALAIIVIVVFGWIALGLEVGLRTAKVVNWDLHEAAAAALGTLILALIAGGVNFLPCIGWLFPFAIHIIGFGGVTLALFGQRSGTAAAPAAVVLTAPAAETTEVIESAAVEEDEAD